MRPGRPLQVELFDLHRGEGLGGDQGLYVTVQVAAIGSALSQFRRRCHFWTLGSGLSQRGTCAWHAERNARDVDDRPMVQAMLDQP